MMPLLGPAFTSDAFLNPVGRALWGDRGGFGWQHVAVSNSHQMLSNSLTWVLNNRNHLEPVGVEGGEAGGRDTKRQENGYWNVGAAYRARSSWAFSVGTRR